MNELQIFENSQLGTIRAIEKDGEPWFVLKDVCETFGETNYRRVAARLDDDEKGVSQIATHGGNQNMTIVNEPGLYYALFTMQPEKARGVSDEYIENRIKQLKSFKRWITHEVIPSIRKTGAYRTKANQAGADKAALTEAKLNNSRARLASEWRKLAEKNPVPEYRQICDHYASAALAGKAVLPLPEVGERTYTAEEVGGILGISANKVGRIANENCLKTPEYGVEVWDKAKHSAKQVPAWRYNGKAVDRLREILNS